MNHPKTNGKILVSYIECNVLDKENISDIELETYRQAYSDLN